MKTYLKQFIEQEKNQLEQLLSLQSSSLACQVAINEANVIFLDPFAQPNHDGLRSKLDKLLVGEITLKAGVNVLHYLTRNSTSAYADEFKKIETALRFSESVDTDAHSYLERIGDAVTLDHQKNLLCRLIFQTDEAAKIDAEKKRWALRDQEQPLTTTDRFNIHLESLSYSMLSIKDMVEWHQPPMSHTKIAYTTDLYLETIQAIIHLILDVCDQPIQPNKTKQIIHEILSGGFPKQINGITLNTKPSTSTLTLTLSDELSATLKNKLKAPIRDGDTLFNLIDTYSCILETIE